MPPPGHDQLTRHAARWCARWPPVPGVSAAGHSRPAGNVVMHDRDLRPGKAGVGAGLGGSPVTDAESVLAAGRKRAGPD